MEGGGDEEFFAKRAAARGDIDKLIRDLRPQIDALSELRAQRVRGKVDSDQDDGFDADWDGGDEPIRWTQQIYPHDSQSQSRSHSDDVRSSSANAEYNAFRGSPGTTGGDESDGATDVFTLPQLIKRLDPLKVLRKSAKSEIFDDFKLPPVPTSHLEFGSKPS